MKVKLLRELLVEPSDTQATARDTVVEMDDARARDLAGREPPLVELQGKDKESKKAPEPDNKMAADPDNKSPEPVSAPVKQADNKTVGTVRK